MGARLNEGQWMAVLQARHTDAQRVRGRDQRDNWQRAFAAVKKEVWLMARCRGLSPRDAYNEWSASRVLSSLSGAR